MPVKLLDLHVLSALTADGRLLFATRMLRLFGYGLVSIVLALYLADLGFNAVQIGLLLTLTLLGDTVISLWITTRADRAGRKRMLIVGAVLMCLAGIAFVVSSNFIVLVVAATIGVISPSGNEVGPFLAIEQAALSHLIPGNQRTAVFAWYNLAGSVATALGALAAGFATHALQSHGYSPADSFRAVLLGYALIGGVLGAMFLFVSAAVEPLPSREARPAGLFLGLHRSRRVVLQLSALFSIDSFAGGFVMQSLLALWFHQRFGTDEAMLGAIFFGANLLAAVSALSASRLAERFGLLPTMVFTHIPANVLLILVPLMPNETLAVILLLARFSISQMDVPTRQAYTMAVVDPDERSAAAGVTGIARTTGAALSPVLATHFLATPSLLSAPFYLAGGLKILYDLALWRSFRAHKPREETLAPSAESKQLTEAAGSR